jgi:hypothetical protein
MNLHPRLRGLAHRHDRFTAQDCRRQGPAFVIVHLLGIRASGLHQKARQQAWTARGQDNAGEYGDPDADEKDVRRWMLSRHRIPDRGFAVIRALS